MEKLTAFLEAEKTKFIEEGADLEHNRWSKWQKYLHSKCEEHTVNSLNSTTRQYEDIPTGNLIIPRELRNRWDRQISTNYADLSEQEKESDRNESRTYIPLLTDHDTRLINFLLDTIMEEIEKKSTKITEKPKEYKAVWLDDISTIINNLKVK